MTAAGALDVDVAIVGGGPAGAVLAERIAARPAWFGEPNPGPA